jgi:sortase A
MTLSIAPSTNGKSPPGGSEGAARPEVDNELVSDEARRPFSEREDSVAGGETGGTAEVVSLPLWVRFCEDIVWKAEDEALASGLTPARLSDADWRLIWESGQGLPPAEAVGRAVMISQLVADEFRDRAARFSAASSSTVEYDDRTGTAAPVPNGLQPAGSSRSLVADVPSEESHAAPPFFLGIGGDAVAKPDVAPTSEVITRRIGPRTLRTLFVIFGWMRNIGAIVILFAAWQLWGTSIEQSHAQETLRQEFRAHVQHVTTTPAGPVLLSTNSQLPQPHEGSVVGHLQIPAIGVDQFVVEGTAEGDLSQGPGHYIGTSIPGQSGNVAIAGHRTTYGAPFNRLDQVKINDRILLTTDSGELLTYVVTQSPIAVSPRDVAVLNPANDNRLTLTTCNPKFSASQRLVVVGLLSEPQAAAATKVSITSRTVRIVTDSSSWNFDYVPEVLGVLLLLVLLGLFNGRARAMYGRVGHVIVVAPVWAAGLYFLFLTLTKLLPSNL